MNIFENIIFVICELNNFAIRELFRTFGVVLNILWWLKKNSNAVKCETKNFFYH